ncbi:MAG: ABC transporter ATP-binding protein [Paracoccaceae bacterium]|nr:ABC transporter ATP-binding protein [Paracoccaceae bacterium]
MRLTLTIERRQTGSESFVKNETILSVKGLKTEFALDEGTAKAVDGVSFQVDPGKVVGLVGESGCGKSVTIKSIMGIIQKPGKVVEGRIFFRPKQGENLVDLRSYDSRGEEMRNIRGNEIALIPQEPMAALSPVHTIGNQLVEAIRLHRNISKKQAEKVAVERMRQVGVPSPEERMDVYSWQLSGGLRQRVMIAMALMCDPRLLIADEPTTAIDVTTQAQVLSLLRELQSAQGLAMIFITHDLGVVAQIADYVVVMYLGKVVEQGPVDDIFHSPCHPYTKALLASIPTIHTPAREELPTIGGSLPHPFNRPTGCPFYPRCTAFIPGTCDKTPPTVTHISAKHSVSCFLHSVNVVDTQ